MFCSISTLTIVLIIKSVYVLVLNRVELRKSRRVAKPYRIANDNSNVELMGQYKEIVKRHKKLTRKASSLKEK